MISGIKKCPIVKKRAESKALKSNFKCKNKEKS